MKSLFAGRNRSSRGMKIGKRLVLIVDYYWVYGIKIGQSFVMMMRGIERFECVCTCDGCGL